MTSPRPPGRFANPLLAAPAPPGAPDLPATELPRHVGIVGAGTIGPDIGYYLKSALPALALTLVDVAPAALEAAVARFADYAAKGVANGKLSAEQAAAVRRGLSATVDYDALAGCDWVIEAATENLELKQRIFARLEAIVAPGAMLTSNTSSLPATRIFAGLARPGRATVTHFFAPAWRNPIVEVVDWAGADPALIDQLRRVFCLTGKVPLVTTDVACFMLDRIFDNWCNEAAHLLDAATAAQIDGVAGEFAHAGPFFVLNLANGNPIIVETNDLQADEEGEHYRPAAVFRSVERWRTGRLGERAAVPATTASAIRDRLLGVLLSQSVDILDRGIGAPADLEIGCRLALGLRDGPLALMDRLGDAEVQRLLGRFARERPGMPMPQRPLAAYRDTPRQVLVDEVGGVAVLTIRRPEALNALNDTVTDELLDAIDRRAEDPSICGFVITGYGSRAFCAGAEIGRFAALLGDADAAADYARECSRLLVRLDRLRKPVVAAVNGLALGGGLELAMRCHRIVAMRDARLQFPEITLGIVPGIGAMVVPFRRWPDSAQLFLRMLRRAESLSAGEAFAQGIVSGLADDPASLLATAVTLARSMASIGAGDRSYQPIRESAVGLEPAPGALAPAQPEVPARAASGLVLSAQVLDILDAAVGEAARAPTLAEALEVGYRAFGRSACTAAAREGIAAFGAHRTPDFTATG